MNDTTFQGNGKITYVPVVVDAKPKPITNADVVRAMSDVELAIWINHIQADAYGSGIMETDIVVYPNTYSNWLDWLKEINDGKEEKEENQSAK